MARRMVLGNLDNGQIDLRISRPGYDAMTANVNDRNQISFSMLRDSFSKVAASGSIYGTSNWVYFQEGFAAPPPVLFGSQINGTFRVGDYVRVDGNSGRYYDGSPHVAVVTTWGICVQHASPYWFYLDGVNKFTYLAVGR